MKSDLTRREAAVWSLILLSSGEKSLADHAEEAGQRMKGGQEVRLIDIPADAGSGYGLFEHIHGLPSSKAFAEALGEASCRFYGAAFRRWLDALVERRASLAARAKDLAVRFEREHVPADSSAEVGRAGRWFALIAAAGELATETGITGWTAGEAKRGAATCFEAWLSGRPAGIGNVDEEAGLSQVRHFLESHGSSRFESEEWQGNYPEKTINRAGKRRRGKHGLEFWIMPEVFRYEVCKGFNADAVARALEKRGFLLRGDGKNLAKRDLIGERKISSKAVGTRPRYYVVLDSILEGDGGDDAPGGGMPAAEEVCSEGLF